MTESRASTGKILIFALVIGLFAVAGGLYYWLSPQVHAACVAEDGHLGNYQPTAGMPMAPDTPVFDQDGKERRLGDHKGRGVVLNFWATWCAPCVREMPQLNRLRALVEANKIDVLTVSEDRKGVPLILKFYQTNNLTDLPVLHDRGGKLLRDLNGKGLPTTVLITPDGREAGRVTGVAEWDSAEAVAFLRRCLSH